MTDDDCIYNERTGTTIIPRWVTLTTAEWALVDDLD